MMDEQGPERPEGDWPPPPPPPPPSSSSWAAASPPPPAPGTASTRAGGRRTGLVVAASVAATLVVVLVAAAVGLQLRSGGGAEPRTTVAAPVPQPTSEGERSSTDLSAAELAASFGDAVWRVEADGCGSLSTGTAFAVDERTLITNWHVTVTDATPTLVSRDGEVQLPGRVVGWSERPDIAVIVVDQELPVTLDWADASVLREGEPLVALGYPVPASDFTVTPATIMSFQVEDDRRQAIRADGAIDKGNSGGPALTSAGEVAGVVTEMAVSDGFQIVPLVYTHEHLVATIDEILGDAAGVEADCGAAGTRPELPEGWDAWDGQEAAGPSTYGDDSTLDRLWDECADGRMAACDELYFTSPYGSEYEAFGGSCGERDPSWGWCGQFDPAASDGAGGGTDAPDDTPASSAPTGPDTHGDDPALDRLWDACADADWDACDDLYLESPFDSRYEEFGATCGDRTNEAYGGCRFEMRLDAHDYGDDATFDRLWDACADGDWQACDDLYLESPFDSRYEEYGSTCGDRDPERFGACEAEHGAA